jgi:hypothetical protein
MVFCIGKTRGLEPLVLGGDLGEGIFQSGCWNIKILLLGNFLIAIRNKPKPTQIKAPAHKTGENARCCEM